MRDILFKAKRKDNGEWVEGFYFCMCHDDGRHIHHFIMPLGVDLSLGTPIEQIQVEIDAETLCQYTELTAYWTAFENEPQEWDVWEHDLLEVEYEGKKVIAEVKYEGGMFILASNEFIDSYIPLFDVVQIEDDYWIDAEVIGTVEEFKALKEKMQDVEITIINRMQEFYDEYRSISQSRVDHFGGKADAIETSQNIVKGVFKDVLGIDW